MWKDTFEDFQANNLSAKVQGPLDLPLEVSRKKKVITNPER